MGIPSPTQLIVFLNPEDEGLILGFVVRGEADPGLRGTWGG
jgi:hypothetical protein